MNFSLFVRPAAVREAVNLMLHDSVPYSAISEKLATLGHPGITGSNISRWKQGGYSDWLPTSRKKTTANSAIHCNPVRFTANSHGARTSVRFTGHLFRGFGYFGPAISAEH
jgi:hypothetical protein